MFLTEEQVVELTGYKRAADQAKWLKRNGVQHFRQRINGRVIIARDALAVREKVAEVEGPRLDWIPRRKRR